MAAGKYILRTMEALYLEPSQTPPYRTLLLACSNLHPFPIINI